MLISGEGQKGMPGRERKKTSRQFTIRHDNMVSLPGQCPTHPLSRRSYHRASGVRTLVGRQGPHGRPRACNCRRTSQRRTDQMPSLRPERRLQLRGSGKGHDAHCPRAIWPHCPRGPGHLQQDHSPSPSAPSPTRHAFLSRQTGRQLRAVGPHLLHTAPSSMAGACGVHPKIGPADVGDTPPAEPVRCLRGDAVSERLAGLGS